MINVLVVEDSRVVREFLIHLLGSDPNIRVIGAVADGEEALEAVARERPDVVTMDIHMPKMDGLEATRRIMETNPVPIVIVSGSGDPKEVATTFRAMEAGALAVLPRPVGMNHPEYEAMARELVQTVKLMSEVKVVRRWARIQRNGAIVSAVRAPPLPKQSLAEIKLVAIGASTGGPLALQTILSALSNRFPVPVLIVQHMVADFIPGFVEWLDQTCSLPVRVAAHGESILPGHAYMAPGGYQMKVETGQKISLTRDLPENGHRPSVSSLFRSVAQVFGSRAVGVLLTGMGKDGAEELRLMKDQGAMTFAQDEESSVVHGMPGEAIRLGGAAYVLPPDKIAAALTSLANKK
ncbi:chemotaxis-specific protein-glutamate methyltransferase CheB [Candidatus Manganitrophus noduliformans]|uniref:Protein-glutamate methylesterase/protein-glutamine glutaminase n=1 Tax=Candidatus Manganitrophus noduliformans TaxID=2606439 RepID=A0A7X6DU43_9BACT|nr:chemotaxis-specific protein-glutamate methyltransferase CheB [Candidatus Manganitrophus noduliformans]NKE73445.1 chemotaxis-specific protein-glutamate methyltransferase CheB [Candidatus Manganitrophus noduliformans]